jgi:phosphonate transport system substrate-binding protein
MQLGQWFADGTLDLALFGGVTYVKAHRELGAVPLVLRDVDGRFSSVILVSASNTAETIEDLKNQSFAFGSPLSTSGHIMPRYFMQKENLIPETFFREVKYSGAHDKTAAWVREGKVAAGAANSDIVQNMFLDGRLSVDDVRVLWESPPYPDYVWAVHPSLDESVPIRIRDAFLLLSDGDPSHQKLLKHLGATHYLPAQHADFQPVEEIIFPAGLLGAQDE